MPQPASEPGHNADQCHRAATPRKAASQTTAARSPARLLAWYDRHHRDLPWRVPPARLAHGVRPDPYRVWLSEIMLQQTTVEAVKPYFRDFLDEMAGRRGARRRAEPTTS